jgi:hypothetical protein
MLGNLDNKNNMENGGEDRKLHKVKPVASVKGKIVYNYKH